MIIRKKLGGRILVPVALGVAASVSGMALFSQGAAAATVSGSVGSANTNSLTYGGTSGAGNAPITNLKLDSSTIALGKTLFVENCSSCHGDSAGGTSRAPNLVGLGAATIDFWVSTGRMPLADPTVQAIAKPSRFTRAQTLAIDAYVSSLATGGPQIPVVNLGAASLSVGEGLFSTNCAGCHTITGVGDALADAVYAPSLYPATSTQIAEAVRTGPGNMPRFGTGNLSDQQVADIVKYVKYLQHPNNAGGIGLGHVGPVTEGFVGILIGLGSLMIAGYWIGGRAH
ncbi:MAG: c-type cytochrome [Acidimicrobiaceae bacterium]|nr:c-type cytochrome [Acidimicrobiaceae bacterium]